MPQKLVIASNNKGKIAELTDLLGPLGLEPVAQGELGVGEAEEPAVTFVENAILKARHAARETGLPALADDSGLAVDALGGQPGVRSSRYAGANATDADQKNPGRCSRKGKGFCFRGIHDCCQIKFQSE